MHKILFLPSWYPSKEDPTNGIFIKEHAKAVSSHNEVVVLYNEGYDKNLKKIWHIISDKKENGIQTIRIKNKQSLIPKISYFFYLWSIKQAFKKLLEQGWKPDIIHAHIYIAGVPAVLLGKKYKIPVIISEHFSWFPRHKLSLFDCIRAGFAMKRAKIILPVSKNLKESVESYGIKNKFKIVPNVVDFQIFYPSFYHSRENKKKILFVGLLRPIKGVPYLLQSLSQLKQKRQDFVLDIIGDGPNENEYKELVQKLAISNFVRFHGLKSKEEIAEFMRNCDFFVSSSLWENLPCVLIEAMASGLPIVASKVGGVPEIINKKVGVLTPPKDVDELAKAIDYMLDHYKDYSPQKISEYAKSKFSYEIVGKRLDRIYREIARKKGNIYGSYNNQK